ncbi:MAG: hypothetical protein KDD62_09030 [Bdellovibrionales bacterium]|nr:hypothetical protein [Bdellovibrionales bacterium]
MNAHKQQTHVPPTVDSRQDTRTALALVHDQVILPWARSLRRIDPDCHVLATGSSQTEKKLKNHSDLDLIVLSEALKDPTTYATALEELQALAKTFEEITGIIPVFFAVNDKKLFLASNFEHSKPDAKTALIHFLYYANTIEMFGIEQSRPGLASILLSGGVPVLPSEIPPRNMHHESPRELFDSVHLERHEIPETLGIDSKLLEARFVELYSERRDEWEHSEALLTPLRFESERALADLVLNIDRLSERSRIFLFEDITARIHSVIRALNFQSLPELVSEINSDYKIQAGNPLNDFQLLLEDSMIPLERFKALLHELLVVTSEASQWKFPVCPALPTLEPVTVDWTEAA